MGELKEIDKDRFIVLHNNLINGKLDLSLLEIRAFLYMVSEIKPTTKNGVGDLHFKPTKIPISMITNSVGGNTFNIIKKFNDELVTKPYKVREIITDGKDKGKEVYKNVPIFAEVKYTKGSNYIVGEFNYKMKPYLLNLLGNFTSSQLKFILKLKNINSIKIYLFLKEYLDFGEREIEYEKLKDLLLLNDNYSKYYDFKRKVLNVAKADLADSDMSFDIIEQRVGRNIGKINFILTKDVKELRRIKRTNKPKPTKQPGLFDQPAEQPTPRVENKIDTSGYTPHQLKVYDRMVYLGFDSNKADQAVTQAKDIENLLVFINQEIYSDKKDIGVVWFKLLADLEKGVKLKVRPEKQLHWDRVKKNFGW
jgi:plasmid replication initiation protein